jgi:hypothetical protein
MRFFSAYTGILFGFIFLFSSCGDKADLKAVKVTESGGAKIADTTLFNVLEMEKGIKIDLSYNSNSDEVIQRIMNREIDMGIISNNMAIRDGMQDIRTITPLLPRVLMIFSKVPRADHFPDIFNGKIVYYEITGDGDEDFLETMIKHYGITGHEARLFDGEAPYPEIKAQLDSADIWISISHFRNYLIDSLYEYGFHLQGKYKNYEGSSLDAFSIKYPQAYPMVIPKYLYNAKPEKPIFTLGIRDLLVCHEDMSESVVYDIVQVISEKRNLLMQRDRNYNLLPYLDEEKYRLSFPLHDGTRSYLNREKPSFLERYAEVIALVFSITVLAGGYIAEKVQDVILKRKKIARLNRRRSLRSKLRGDD